jgi:HEAT repeat protein
MTAARYLGYFKDRDAIPALRQALNDPHRAISLSDTPGMPNQPFYPVREQAARALRELGLKVERRGDTFVVQ